MLWLGGPPGTGKTTVASIVARRHGLRPYSADTRTWQQRDRAQAAGNAAGARWEALTPQARREQLDDELIAQSLHRERSTMVVDDLLRLPDSPLILAEGAVIRPQDIPAGAAAVWLTADAETVRRRVGGRDGSRNHLYELLVEVIAADVGAARAPTIDARADLAATVAAVEAFFAPLLARGPLATDVVQRQQLLREANLDIVEQVRRFYARPWTVGNPEAVVRSFICECGATTCAAFVEVSVGSAAVAPAIAAGHPLAT